MRHLSMGLVWAFLALSVAQPAHAYLDPGTGSYVLSVAVASILGVGYAIKTYWLNIKAHFANMLSRKKPD